jgi:hypothetical protein
MALFCLLLGHTLLLARRLSQGNTWVAGSRRSSLKSRKVLERNTRISRDSEAAVTASAMGVMQQLHSFCRGFGVVQR